MSAPQPAVTVGARSSPLARARTELVATSCGRRGQGFLRDQADRDHRETERRPVAGRCPRSAARVSSPSSSSRRCTTGRSTSPSTRSRIFPTEAAVGVEIGAVSARDDVRECLVSRDGLALGDLPAGAVVGTSSLRRQAQLSGLRPDLETRSIRGNVDTRIRKVREGEYDGVLWLPPVSGAWGSKVP